MSALHFQALQLANEQRNAYGLRYNDYQRYRKHCANRTHRLRSSLKMTHGKGRDFKKLPPVKLENIKDGYLQLLLFEAERAWVYSRELSDAGPAPGQAPNAAAARRNATGRFRRAVNWSTQLLSHCQSLYASGRLSASSLIQATIYTLILNGRFLRARDEFEDALIQLAIARSLLNELAAHAATSRDQALATAFADEIGPEIRYCAHELGRKQVYDIDAIVTELSGAHRSEIVEGYDKLVQELGREGAATAGERRKLEVLMWENEPVPVRNPELVDVLLKVQEAERRLKHEDVPEEKGEGARKDKVGKGARSKRGVAAYDAVLSALSDAEEVARKLAEAQQLSRTASGSSGAARDIHFVHAYIMYQLLSRRTQRDLLLISTLLHQSQTSSHPAPTKVGGKSATKPEQFDARLFPAVVKLLDTITQTLNQMRTLSVVDESPDLASAVEARISFTKARRCRYLSRCYVALKKYAEALTLIQHANIHLREARSVLFVLSSSDADLPHYPLTAADLDSLDADLVADGLSLKKSWFAHNGGAIDKDGEGKKAYKKPLFFDIALNYVPLDMERLQERAGKKVVVKAQPAPIPTVTEKKTKVEDIERVATPEPSSAPARGGLSSLLGGWWGRN